MTASLNKPNLNFKLSLPKKRLCEEMARAEGRSLHNWIIFHGQRLLAQGNPVSTGTDAGPAAPIRIKAPEFGAKVRQAARKHELTHSEVMRWIVDQMLKQ